MAHARRHTHSRSSVALAALLSGCLLLPACAAGTRPTAQKWVASWGQAMTSQYVRVAGSDGKPVLDAYGQPVERAPAVDHLTLRQSVNVSAGGGRVRIRLSNYYGRAPLTVSAARIALGAVADRPLRIAAVESAVVGLSPAKAADAARAALRTAIKPIDDVRSTATYRLEVAENLVARFFSGILS